MANVGSRVISRRWKGKIIHIILKQKLFFLSSNNVDNDENNSNDDVSSGGDGGGDGKGVVRFEYAQRIRYAS